MDIFIQDAERIVGYQTSDPNGLFHPIDMNWRSVQRLVNSKAGATLLDERGREEFNELCQYWKGRCMSDRQQEMFGGDLAKYWKYEGTFLWSHWVEGGIPDYDSLFRTGLNGRIKMVEEKLAEIERDVPRDYIDQKEFLKAVHIVLKAVINFANRYAVLAREMAASAQEGKEKSRLIQLAQTCERVPAEPPRTFLEAVQFFFFIHLVKSRMGCSISTRSIPAGLGQLKEQS